ncbi:MAG: acylneuraminate cytidylyltransferase family protein [Nitrosarchaeum sp.]|nr:acylneuraminate cytidylyltransferase family protein [Nitrosarchaeum sp.]
MKSICFIGARGGSKGVKRKNIKLLGGKPLISYTIESALDSKCFTNVIVSTEDKEIASIARQYGADVPFMRPKKLATDSSGMSDVLIHGILKLRSLGYDVDIIVNRDCTVPFIGSKEIQNAITLFKKSKCNGVYSVFRQHQNPYFNMMEPDSNGYLQLSKKPKHKILRRQDAPVVYQLNGLFVINPEKLMKYKSTIMPKILPFEISPEQGFMIDTELEFKLAELMLKE